MADEPPPKSADGRGAPMSARANAPLIAAAVAACGAALAQPEIVSIDPEAQLLDRIAALRAEGGPTPAGVVEPLLALAVLYQEAGSNALASATLEEARYVTRVHQGLASADEALLLRQQIRAEKELGAYDRVWDLEQDMLTIARQHHDDSRVLSIFRDLADDRAAVAEIVRTGGPRPAMIYLGCYYGAPLPPYDDTRGERRAPAPMGQVGGDQNCYAGSRSTLLYKLRAEVLMYYADAIEVVLKTGDYASQELRDLERAAISLRSRARVFAMRYGESDGPFTRCPRGTLDQYLALTILSSCLAPVGRADGFVVPNVGGEVGLLRLIAYEIRSGAPAVDRARAVAELADWYLLSAPLDRRHLERSTDRALVFYERAYRELQQADAVDVATAQIFTPDLPVTLPTHQPNPFAAAATTAASRYIDVSFAITRLGRGEKIEILDSSKGATRAEQRDLVRLIEGTSFRPRVVDGEIADSAPVVVRYHLAP